VPSSLFRSPILVTGARGTIGARLLLHLTDAGVDVRAASSHPRPDETRLNLHDPTTFPAALRGVEQVFLYANAETAADFATAAAEAGVTHVVLLSSNAARDAGPLGLPFLAVENALTAGPVPVTVLRPGAFAGNARQWIRSVRAERTVRLPYPGASLDTVDENDVAEVAHRSLTVPGLRGSTLDLTGPAAVSLADQVHTLAGVLGEDITVDRITREQWKQSVSKYVSADYAEALLNYWKASEERPAELTTTVRDLTGHPATGFDRWAYDNIGLFR
jgi:uncharacterized protein YbjT (DUF2867 family)